ncbi:MAG: sodium:calcium antiporter [Actinomyces sp.]|nr:MAG: sodium:calcium antiporter [Actinomyces sp.]
MLLGLVLTIGSLVVLAIAADEFVAGAGRVAAALGISPLLIGAVIIGFGTSAPEFVVSTVAAARDNLDIGVGNVIGSNIANISVVLGITTWVCVIPVSSRTVRREAVVSVGAVVAFALLVQNGFTRDEGLVLAALLVAVTVLVLVTGRGDEQLAEEVREVVGDGGIRVSREAVRTVVGLAAVVASAQLLVAGAERLADTFGISGGFIGFTLIALGTSAPELLTALAAARRGEIDLLVGNLLGSNVFNSLAVGASIALVGPGPVADGTLVSLGSIMMVVIAGVSWIAMGTRGPVNRLEGSLLISLWVLSVLLLGSSGEAAALGLG